MLLWVFFFIYITFCFFFLLLFSHYQLDQRALYDKKAKRNTAGDSFPFDFFGRFFLLHFIPEGPTKHGRMVQAERHLGFGYQLGVTGQQDYEAFYARGEGKGVGKPAWQFCIDRDITDNTK